jgi:hypothetical protein
MKAPKLQLTLTSALPPPGMTANAIRTSSRLTRGPRREQLVAGDRQFRE